MTGTLIFGGEMSHCYVHLCSSDHIGHTNLPLTLLSTSISLLSPIVLQLCLHSSHRPTRLSHLPSIWLPSHDHLLFHQSWHHPFTFPKSENVRSGPQATCASTSCYQWLWWLLAIWSHGQHVETLWHNTSKFYTVLFKHLWPPLIQRSFSAYPCDFQLHNFPCLSILVSSTSYSD